MNQPLDGLTEALVKEAESINPVRSLHDYSLCVAFSVCNFDIIIECMKTAYRTKTEMARMLAEREES